MVSAALGTLVIHVQGRNAEGLDRPKHHRPAGALVLHAVFHEDGLPVVWLQVIPNAFGDDDRVRIRLDGPIMGLPAGIHVDNRPHLHKHQRVRGCAILGLADRSGRGDCEGLDVLAEGDLLVAHGRILVASENAHILGELLPNEFRLIALSPEHRDAVQRWAPPHLRHARDGTRRVLVLMQPLLHILESRLLAESVVPRGMLLDTFPDDPLHILVALIPLAGCFALTWLRAPELGILM
mmetsp:Transcript_18716/g.37668  ORF Transcript_18716/g.37668 Transcript_18716/m.37668 type:complete len:238 (-) Transcript_18716:934-1647(-)